jgi:hypothetical protein
MQWFQPSNLLLWWADGLVDGDEADAFEYLEQK